MPESVWNPRVYPAGGWNFVDDAGVRHSGATLDGLVKAVVEFRSLNGVSPGDPRTEITEKLCKRFPDACRGGDLPNSVARTHNPAGSEREKMALAVTVWLSKVARALARVGRPDQNFTNKAEADLRADICRVCPKQTRWDTGCGSCSQGHRRMSFALRRGREATYGPQLLACGVLSEDTRTSVFLADLQPVKSDELPDNCWRKQR